jgi:hypothetical protein
MRKKQALKKGDVKTGWFFPRCSRHAGKADIFIMSAAWGYYRPPVFCGARGGRKYRHGGYTAHTALQSRTVIHGAICKTAAPVCRFASLRQEPWTANRAAPCDHAGALISGEIGMAIDSIGSNTSYTQLLNSTSSARKYGSDDGAGASITASSGGKFADAIGQALSQLGVSAVGSAGSSAGASGSATDGSSSSSDQGGSAAVASFADQLFAALQSQIGAQSGAQSSAAATTTDAGSAVSGVGGASGGTSSTSGGGSVASAPVSGGGGHHHHGGGGGKVAGGLDSLIQQLSTSSDSVATSADGSGASALATTGSDAVGATATTSATGATANSARALQSSYDALVAASGNSGNAPSLTQFLQTLSQNLHGAPTAGNVVSTKA